MSPVAETAGDALWDGEDAALLTGERLTVDEYLARAAAGEYEDRRVELLDGWVIEKMGQNPAHILGVILTQGALTSVLPAGFHAHSQFSVRLTGSMPEPDVTVRRGTARDYAQRHATYADMPLVAEVSEATLRRDRRTKRRLYAAAGVPVYWIVNLIHDQLEVYDTPTAGDYAPPVVYGRDDDAPVVIDGTTVGMVRVADLLP